jgi:lysophospholipase L1-like esterase
VKERLGLIVAATLVALASCEVIARILFPAPPDPTRQPQIVFRYDPDIRYVTVPNQRGWVDDGFVTTNSLGFRGPEIALPKPHGRLRIVAVGDSVTFGFGVNDTETFCWQTEQTLRARMPGVDLDVVNLAVPGYDTRQEVGLLKRNVARMQPDLVLVGFYTNDVPYALGDKDSTTAADPAAVGGTTIAAANPVAGQVLHMNPAPTSWLDGQLRKSRAIYTTGHALKRLVRRDEGKTGSSLELDMLESRDLPQLDAAWGRVSRQLADLQSIAMSADFSVGIVVLPPREQVAGLFPDSQYQKRIRAIADKLGFFVIDPLPSMAASKLKKDTLFIPYDRNHPSAAGHRVIADAIADYLTQHDELRGISKRFAMRERSQ